MERARLTPFPREQATTRICMVSSFATELLEIRSRETSLHVLFIPGNPGIAAFYKDFVEALYENLGGQASITAIGHISHGQKGSEHGRLFSLHEQIGHKVDFIEQELLHSKQSIVLVGHSIGAYIGLEIFKRLQKKVRTVFIDGLSPSWDEDRDKKYLKKYGAIEKIELARNMPAARRKDFGFVTFDTHDNAVVCADGITNCEIGEGDNKAKYGRIVDIDLKIPPRPPGYAFVEFEDPRDAEDAIHGRDGYNFDGNRLRVELAHGGRGNSSSFSNSYGGGGRHGGVSRHSEYRVLVTGLPSSASWQDLKDHMRKAGDVCYSEVYREGSGTIGIADYTNYDDVKYAIRKLDDTEFKNAFSRAFIRVKEYDGKRGRSYSRSRSRSRSRSYSRSRSPSKSPKDKPSRRSASRSRSRSVSSRSPSGSKGRSPSRSPARSRSPNASPANGEAASPKKHSPSRSP